MDLTRVDEKTFRSAIANEEVEQQVDELFTYKPWDEAQIQAGKFVREDLAAAYLTILKQVPPCPTRTRALNMLVDCRMLANAAITHKGKY